MNNFGQTQFDGAVILTLPASLGTHPVRLAEYTLMLSGVSPVGHTHVLDDLTDWENVGQYVAAVLVALPEPLRAITRNVAPLSARVVAGVVYQFAVAPAISTPFFCH